MISEMITTAQNATPEQFLRSSNKCVSARVFSQVELIHYISCVQRPASNANLTMINDDSNPDSTSTSPKGGWPRQHSQSKVPPPSGSAPVLFGANIDLDSFSFTAGDVDTGFLSSRIL